MYCYKCGKCITEDSVFCPSCGVKIKTDNNSSKVIPFYDNSSDGSSDTAKSDNYDNTPSLKDTLINGAIAIVVLLLIISAAKTLIGNYKSSGSIEAAVSDTIKAFTGASKIEMDMYKVAKDVIRKKISCPSTAAFPAYNEDFITGYSPRYTVKAYVDHENLMGAKVRTHYTVVIEIMDDRYQCTVTELY